MSGYNIQAGDFGQKLARNFLIARGYKILEEKFTAKGGEVDIVAERDNQLVFAEEKTRLSAKFGLPEEAVDKRKKEKMLRVAYQYLVAKEVNHENFRLDLLAVEIDRSKKTARIRQHMGI